jgi:hypothetical protein
VIWDKNGSIRWIHIELVLSRPEFSDWIQTRVVDDVSNSEIHHIWMLEFQL